jgi:hypothetical protein
MFELAPEPEFSAWFETLAEPLAEEVVTALEVVARAGETLEPPGVSRALLWFDGTGTPGVARGGSPGLELVLSQSAEGVRALVAWQRELVSCLDSAAFRHRLEELSAPNAASALASVAELRAELGRWQRELFLRLGTGKVSLDVLERRRAALKREFSAVLELLSLSPGRFITLANGLRELTLLGTDPALRILFGVDTSVKRLVVLLGEPLTRAYYGDSVRFAEARWASYQERALARPSP